MYFLDTIRSRVSLRQISDGISIVVMPGILGVMISALVSAALTFDACMCGCWIHPVERTTALAVVYSVLFALGLFSGIALLFLSIKTEKVGRTVVSVLIIIIAILGLLLMLSVSNDISHFTDGFRQQELLMQRP